MNFDKIINRCGTYCTQWDYIKDRFGQDNLLPFTISDMDFQSPTIISETLKKRLEHGVFGYSRWNHNDFKGAITSWFEKRFNSIFNNEWVVYCPSVIYTISYFIRQYSKENDGILIQIPSYDGFFKVINTNKRKIIENKLIIQDGHYKIDFQDFEEKCKLAKIFILCSPHNPTGRVWTKEELSKIITICQKYNIIILSDEIHMDIDYKRQHIPILSLSQNNIVLISSATKSFNIPSIANAYAIIPENNKRKDYLYNLKEVNSLSSPNILGIIATMTAYQYGEEWLSLLLEYLYNNLQFTKKYLEENISSLTMSLPDGCYFAWINFQQLNISSTEFQERLKKIGKVAIMPGNTYGDEFFLRLNIACPHSKLERGLEGIYKTIKSL